MTRNDRAALKLALEQCRAQDAGRAEQIDSKLKDEPWEEVATFAAYSCQCRSLGLRPWEDPPCWVDNVDTPIEGNDYNNHRAAQQLLRQMLELGVSRWHPDPIAAIEEAKKQKVDL